MLILSTRPSAAGARISNTSVSPCSNRFFPNSACSSLCGPLEAPADPNSVMLTLASVPAPRSSRVVTATL